MSVCMGCVMLTVTAYLTEGAGSQRHALPQPGYSGKE